MSNERPEVIKRTQYSMNSDYAEVTRSMNRESMYPAWNAKADHQTAYPLESMKGEKVRKQVMGRGE